MPGTWSPGDAAIGQRVIPETTVFGAVPTFQQGFATYPKTVTTPGTIASGGTVTNTTGVDVMVYMSATGGIGTGISVSGNQFTQGTFPANQLAAIYLPANGFMTFTYSTVLTWKWLAV